MPPSRVAGRKDDFPKLRTAARLFPPLHFSQRTDADGSATDGTNHTRPSCKGRSGGSCRRRNKESRQQFLPHAITPRLDRHFAWP